VNEHPDVAVLREAAKVSRLFDAGSHFPMEADAAVAALMRMNELVVGPDCAHGVKTPVHGG
jgi:hypothetical protein